MAIRWKSSASFFEYPLVTVAIGPDPAKNEIRGHARGIIAIGDVATGIIALAESLAASLPLAALPSAA